jgi:hypothetical protein
MPANFPGPYQWVLNYVVTGSPGGAQNHVMQLNMDAPGNPNIGTPFADIDVISRDDTTSDLETVTDDIISLLDELFQDSATDFLYVDFFEFEPNSFVRNWISTMVLDSNPTNASSFTRAAQHIYQFRTAEGNIMKVNLLDAIGVVAEPYSYGDLAAGPKALVDYLLADATSFALGRDTSYPIAFLKLFNGTNEKLFRDRYRP